MAPRVGGRRAVRGAYLRGGRGGGGRGVGASRRAMRGGERNPRSMSPWAAWRAAAAGPLTPRPAADTAARLTRQDPVRFHIKYTAGGRLPHRASPDPTRSWRGLRPVVASVREQLRTNDDRLPAATTGGAPLPDAAPNAPRPAVRRGPSRPPTRPIAAGCVHHVDSAGLAAGHSPPPAGRGHQPGLGGTRDTARPVGWPRPRSSRGRGRGTLRPCAAPLGARSSTRIGRRCGSGSGPGWPRPRRKPRGTRRDRHPARGRDGRLPHRR